jgi:hypothetical protein
MNPAAKHETIEYRNTDACVPAVVVVVDMVQSSPKIPPRRAA